MSVSKKEMIELIELYMSLSEEGRRKARQEVADPIIRPLLEKVEEHLIRNGWKAPVDR